VIICKKWYNEETRVTLIENYIGPIKWHQYFGDLSVMLKLYADDVKLYTSYCLHQSPNDLMTGIDRLISWADTRQLKLAPDKCTVCRLESARGRTPHLKCSQCY